MPLPRRLIEHCDRGRCPRLKVAMPNSHRGARAESPCIQHPLTRRPHVELRRQRPLVHAHDLP
eukprot:8118368-Pyramimonas_sp.AAC.1